MQTKYKLDRDTRTLILKYIRKYDEYLLWYKSERDRIISPSRQMDDMPHGSGTSDPTLSAAERLEKLDNCHRAQVIKAIDQARFVIGHDVQDEGQQDKLRRALWLSCLNGYEYNFDTFAGMITCERRQFYNYKNEFLNTIKNLLGL
jgi:hypothetical protein